MDKIIIIEIALIFIYYHISGLATTNILRLTAGNTLNVLANDCHCSNCKSKIPFYLQFPIISYIFCRGKCKNCKSKIPVFPLVLEIFVFVGMTFVCLLTRFSIYGVFFSFLYYEVLRILSIIIKGKRKANFFKQYCIAVFAMIPFLLCSLFAAALYMIV